MADGKQYSTSDIKAAERLGRKRPSLFRRARTGGIIGAVAALVGLGYGQNTRQAIDSARKEDLAVRQARQEIMDTRGSQSSFQPSYSWLQ